MPVAKLDRVPLATDPSRTLLVSYWVIVELKEKELTDGRTNGETRVDVRLDPRIFLGSPTPKTSVSRDEGGESGRVRPQNSSSPPLDLPPGRRSWGWGRRRTPWLTTSPCPTPPEWVRVPTYLSLYIPARPVHIGISESVGLCVVVPPMCVSLSLCAPM